VARPVLALTLSCLSILVAAPGCGGGAWPAGEAVEFDACGPVALVLDADLAVQVRAHTVPVKRVPLPFYKSRARD